MKKLTIEEAYKKATPGPLRCSYKSAAAARKEGEEDGTDGGGGDGWIGQDKSWLERETVAFLPHHRDVGEDEKRGCNAAILAHAFNVLPEVVEALKEICGNARGNAEGTFSVSADRIRSAREILAKASTVEVPE